MKLLLFDVDGTLLLTVGSDVYCINCGYNLRTLAIDRACPECNYPVRESLLSDAKLAWLRKIRTGLTLLVATCMLFFIVYLFAERLLADSATAFVLCWLVPTAMTSGVLGVYMMTRASACVPSTLRVLGLAARVFSVGKVVSEAMLFLLITTSPLVFGAFLPHSTVFLVRAEAVLVYGAAQWLVLVYLYLLLVRLRVNVCRWWLLAMAFSIFWFTLNVSREYSAYQRIAGWKTLGDPYFTHLGGVGPIVVFGAHLAYLVFFWRCRSGVSQLILTHRERKTRAAAA